MKNLIRYDFRVKRIFDLF